MAQSTVAILILIAVIILYATEKLPLSVTTILAMIAMVFCGILTPAEAFSGFSSTATLLLIGITIVGEAFLTSGLVDKLGSLLLKIAEVPLPLFVAIIFMTGAILSAFLNGLAVVAIFMPILDALAYRTEGKLQKKYTLMPLAVGAVLGGNLSVVGSTSMINASNLLSESYYGKSLEFFAPALVAIPSVIVTFVFYLVIGQKLQERYFDFEETKQEELTTGLDDSGKVPAGWKSFFVILIMALCVVGFVSGLDLAAVAFAGAAAVLISGCITTKQAYAGIGWETVFVVSGAIGFAKGVEVSGAGKLIADGVIRLFGPLVDMEFGLCVVILVLSTLLSNFMSNNASVTIIAPIGLALASEMGYNPVPLILACGVGVNLSLATPICTACITMTTAAGYRFKDYLRLGGVINFLSVIVTAAAFYFVYFV